MDMEKIKEKYRGEKWKKRNDRKGIAYLVMKIIMGISIGVLLYCVACIAEFPEWTSQQWAFHFLVTGISAGVSIATWAVSVLIGWADRREQTNENVR